MAANLLKGVILGTTATFPMEGVPAMLETFEKREGNAYPTA